MRDKIAELIEVLSLGNYGGHVINSPAVADAIIAALPDMVKPLEMPERRNGYWGHKDGYQVAHTMGDLFRVRFHGKVICKNIKGFDRAVKWANTHNQRRILSAFGIEGDG